MPRPRLTDRPIDKRVSLRGSLVREVDASLADRLTGRPPYGAWAETLEELLRGWLAGDFKIKSHQPKQLDLKDLT